MNKLSYTFFIGTKKAHLVEQMALSLWRWWCSWQWLLRPRLRGQWCRTSRCWCPQTWHCPLRCPAIISKERWGPVFVLEHGSAHTVGSRILIIKYSTLVRERVWGWISEFKSSSGRPCREFICEFESSRASHCWLLLLLLLLCRLMGRLPIGCMGPTAECLHACFPQSEKQPSLIHLPSSLTLCGCPKGRAWRACERRRLVLGAACMDAPQASSQPRPLP